MRDTKTIETFLKNKEQKEKLSLLQLNFVKEVKSLSLDQKRPKILHLMIQDFKVFNNEKNI